MQGLKSQPQQHDQQQKQKTTARNDESEDDVPHTGAVVRDLPCLANLVHKSACRAVVCLWGMASQQTLRLPPLG